MATRKKKAQKWQRHRNSHLATEYPRKGRCGSCGMVVLVATVTGLDTKLDPYLLNQKGEAEALIRGLRTFYAHHPSFGIRTVSGIRREPTPWLGFIVREHACGMPPPSTPVPCWHAWS